MKTKVQSNSTSDVKKLRAEVAMLRSFAIGVAGRDPEGAYRPEFVRQVLRDAQAKPVTYFEDPEQFLALLETIED